MNILLLNQTFYPDVASTGQHSYDLAAHLVRAGHRVSVIASRSLYGKKGAQLSRRESLDGIEIYRIGISVFGKGAIGLRIVDFCVFWLLAARRAITMERPDVVIALTTPPYIALLAWLIKVLRAAPFVYWVMDLYPDVPVACGILRERGALTRMLEWANRFCLRRADRVVVLGRCMRDRVLAKGIPPSRIARINVWPVEDPADNLTTKNSYREEWGLENSFVVMYSGNVGLGHDIGAICQAMLRLRFRNDIRFVFVGGGKRRPEIESFAAEHALANVDFHPYQPRERLGELLTAADLHLASLSDPAVGTMVPSKVYGVMAAGRPCVFVGPRESEVARALEEAQAGTAVACGAADSLVHEIERLSADRGLTTKMGLRGRVAVLNLYSRDCACQLWEELLSEVCRPPSVAALERAQSRVARQELL